MSWIFETEATPKADRFRCDHSEATVGFSDAGFPVGHCPCCHVTWRRDLMRLPDDRGLARKLFAKPIPSFVPVELAGAWRGYA